MTTPNTVDFGAMNDQQKLAHLEALEQENARLKLSKNTETKGIGLKVSDKGGISVYNLGRFPVTLYAPAWEKLLNHAEDIRAFIAKAAADGALPTDEQIAAGKERNRLARIAEAEKKAAEQAG